MIRLFTPKQKPQELFCQKYWQQRLKEAAKSKIKSEDIQIANFDIHDANCDLLEARGLRVFSKENVQKLIKKMDLKLKLIKPSFWKRTIWRGIPEPTRGDSKLIHNYYNRCLNLKKGDTICMKEFAFGSRNKNMAIDYIIHHCYGFLNRNGILFEITVPRKTKFVNKNISILPRNSQFLCTGSEDIVEQKNPYKVIKLKLLPRKIKHNEV